MRERPQCLDGNRGVEQVSTTTVTVDPKERKSDNLAWHGGRIAAGIECFKEVRFNLSLSLSLSLSAYLYMRMHA